jgi:ATP-dependent helicase/nuclease subunit A
MSAVTRDRAGAQAGGQAAYQADGRPVDRATFYALACDPQRSVVVEACAGAGKTWMLVSRIVRALLAGAQPNEILAITFTRKAAGEMRERLDEWLREFAAPDLPATRLVAALRERGVPPAEAEALAPALAGLHERVLDGGRGVEIRTFHGWFSQLLRAAPLELLDEIGVQRDVELLEDPRDHRPEVFRRFHAALLGDAALRQDYAALTARRGRAQLRRWLEAAWSRRVEVELADAAGTLEDSVVPAAAHWPELAAYAHPAQQLLTLPWRDALREAADALAAPGTAKPQKKAADAIIDALGRDDAQAAFDAAWRALFTAHDRPRPRQLGSAPAVVRLQDRLQLVADQIHQHESHVDHRRMARLARLLLAEYAAYKRRAGLADMADLERCALALLRDATLSAWVQERLDARVRHVLIDEFQDTSPLQWQALHAWLAGYAGAGGGTSGQRPPALFVVGDPKQSIYRFRGAEPKVFDEAAQFVAETFGGTRLACDHTRRNAPEVLGPLNAVFGAAAAAGEFGGFRAHTTEQAAASSEPSMPSTQPLQLTLALDDVPSGVRGDAPGAGVWMLPLVLRPPAASNASASSGALVPAWRDSLRLPRLEPETVLREREAAWVAAAIRELVDSGDVRPGEVMVLSRKRESLRLAAPALQRAHLPYVAVEDLPLTDSPEARDLIALLDLLASPRHRLSLLQVLRCPLFGAGDDELVELATRAEAAGTDWWPALCRHRDGPDAWAGPALRRAAEWLPRWHDSAQRLPPHDLLDRIVHEGALRERVAATVAPERRAAALDAIDAVLGQALLLDGARYSTPYGFARALRRRAIRVAPVHQGDAVQLLTIHGAKGLEARVVFVMDADPQAANGETATVLVDWPVAAPAPRRCAFVYSETFCPASLQGLLADEREAREREELNGLYVAMSRARERLVFSATEPMRPSPGLSWRQRLEPWAQGWVPPAEANVGAPPGIGDASTAIVKVLPERAAANEETKADATARPASTPAPSSAETEHTRLGKAVHRVLEWATAGADGASDVARLAAAAALEFGSPAAQTEKLARTILESPAARPFFAPGGLRWAGNEVPIGDGGDVLRIDRLVLRAGADGDPATWWVLDYKLQHAPQELEAYRAQLLRYRDVMRRAQPGAAVRCAFLTGAGEVIEID